MLIACGGAWAQTISSIMVGTAPANAGIVFAVDGVNYVSTQTFLWPQGSKHIVQFEFTLGPNGDNLPYQSSLDGRTEYFFNGWTENGTTIGGGVSAVTITADPTVTSVIATMSVQYQVQVNFLAGSAATCTGAAPGDPSLVATGYQGGIVFFNGTCVATTTTLFMPAGTVTLVQYPYPGWVFYGWEIGDFLYSTGLSTWTLTGPTTFTPEFAIAKRVHFMTTPPGKTVLVDRTTSQTPLLPSSNGATCNPTQNLLPPLPPAGFPALCLGDFDFLPGSTHTIGGTSPQQDKQGNYWVFEGYTNGMGQNASYVVDTNINSASTLTANYVPGVKVQFITSQNGLKLTVDGTTNFGGGYTFIWGQGESHTISAPATQVDSSGRTWSFVSWSNAGSATQTITIPSNTTQMALTATYAELPQVTITSAPPGLQFSVDGSLCTTPCVVSHALGYTMPVVAPTSLTSGSTSRMNFTSWSDGSTTATRTITFGQNTQSISASYQTQYSLTATATPSGSATFTFNPPTPDGFFPSGTLVTVNVTPATGYKFVKWGGDLTGNFTPGYLTMTGAHAITAFTLSVPAISPAGIMTAAGVTPDGTMAPGSLITIYGQNLAPGLELASGNPLPQALGNVTVTVGNYLLPLLFVSQTQINAQLPVELVDGNYALTIQQTGFPDVPGTLTVSRDAPALFTQANPQNLPLGMALHHDGTLVTFDSPAKRGEQISIYGTGFGPYATAALDGFAIPASPTDNVVDPVTLNVGGIVKTPDSAVAAPGAVGLVLLKMTITSDLPTATTVNFSVTVNSKSSAVVVLPLQ
jgi:uncharacterized protein (TIGR03437 family)